VVVIVSLVAVKTIDDYHLNERDTTLIIDFRNHDS